MSGYGNNNFPVLASGGWINLEWRHNIDELVFATSVVVITAVAMALVRELWFSIMTAFDLPILNKFMYEMIATLELTVAQFEFSFIIYPRYSVLLYFLVMYIYALWVSFREEMVRPSQVTTANPVLVLRKYMKAEVEGGPALILVCGQVLGALLAYLMVILPAWSIASALFLDEYGFHNIEMSAHFWSTASSYETPLFSAFVEGLGTFCICIMPYAFDRFALDPIIKDHMVLVTSTLVAVFAARFSGGFHNPAVASSLEFSTVGLFIGDKGWIYWVFPCVGMLGAWWCEQRLLGPEGVIY